ncbi:50S ribosomal protein L15e [Candidatus Woesearchaeota archaeon]|nr:50S ribosomal protein L15e [Candidatus Woesearchaeota archaeon]
MSFTSYLRESWNNQGAKAFQQKLIGWRREPVSIKLEHPTRIDRARALGYKAKEGFLIVRTRLRKSRRMRPKIKKGRKSSNKGQKLVVNKNYRQIAEERTNKKFINMEVLNSYEVGRDGHFIWYEVILVDPNHPVIKADNTIKWISNKQHRGRAFRGLTSAGRKARGLRNRGKGAEKVRPSLRANKRRLH